MKLLHGTNDIIRRPDISKCKSKNDFGVHYLDDGPLKVFIDRVSQFGSSYIQYCFCTQRAMDILKKL